MKIIVFTVFIVWLIGFSALTWGQAKSRIDLDDMMIKGELHNDDRVMILSRQKNELKNFVKFRNSYREEILQEAPVAHPKR